MGFTGPEPVLDELASALTTYLPAKLDALEAALLPALALPDVAEVTVGARTSLLAYPAVTVAAVHTEVLEESGRQRLRQEHLVQLEMFVTADSEAELERLVLRYTRAAAEVAAERQADYAFRLLFARRRWTYGSIESGGPRAFSRSARIEVRCQRWEDV